MNKHVAALAIVGMVAIAAMLTGVWGWVVIAGLASIFISMIED